MYFDYVKFFWAYIVHRPVFCNHLADRHESTLMKHADLFWNISVIVNNQLTMRVSVRDIVMQGSVWGSLKCTTSMDRLNKVALSDKSLQYKWDPNFPIGVLGFVDDTLGVSECGNNSIRKNSVINSFIETQRQELSKEIFSLYMFQERSVQFPALYSKYTVTPWRQVKVQSTWETLSRPRAG